MTDAAIGAESLARVLLRHYELGRIERLYPMPGAHQRRHRKLVAETGAGRFLVKTYERDAAVLDALHFQHRLAEHLLENGLPVARILPARNGRTIIEEDDYAIELQAYIEGEMMTVTPPQLRVAALALGRFHHVCRDFPCPPRDARKWRFSEVPRELFAHLYELAQQEPGDRGQLDAECNRLALFLREASNELGWDPRNQFETGLIHGDWHSGNLLYQGDDLVAILDLEFAGDGCYLEDLSYAISNLCIRTSVNPTRLAQRTDLLLHYYQKSRTLAPIEERALYYAVGLKHIATICYQCKHNSAVAGFTPRQWMQKLDEQMTWLAERAQRIQFGG
jgi:Ser/Thr protein kinase RdoA (MazF antagonist)